MVQILSAKNLSEVVCVLLNKPTIVDENTTSGAYAHFMTRIAQAVCDFYDSDIDATDAHRASNVKSWFVAISGNRPLPSNNGDKKSDPESASLFWQELLNSVESLTAIAQQYGPRTLADLFYLQNAILSGGFIDHYAGESNVLDVVGTLFSAAKWESYIKVGYMASVNGRLDFG